VTARETAAYEALVRIGSDGWPVTTQEVANALGHHTRSHAHELLHRLKVLGLAVQHPRNEKGGWRAIPA
jgi:DNA-binding IclR family transcriptional regulator